MLQVVWSTLRRRAGRALALVLAIGVATATFTVLTGASETGRLQVTGTVSDSFRSAYDVLVRPAGVSDPIEDADGVVRRDFLAGVPGGITRQQYEQIADIPGVEVAAPIAILGSVDSKVYVPIPLRDTVSATNHVLGVDSVWTTDRGLSQIPADRQAVVRTSEPIDCPISQERPSPFIGSEPPLDCFTPGDDESRNDVAPFGPNGWGAIATWSFPFVVAAVDPVAEASLTGLDEAMVSGTYLDTSELATGIDVPVIAAASTSMDLAQEVTVTKLADTNEPITPAKAEQLRTSGTGPVVARETITAQDAYARLLDQLATTDPNNRISSVPIFFTTSATEFEQAPSGVLRPEPVTTPDSVWATPYYGDGWAIPAPGSDDVGFRRLTPHPWQGGEPARLSSIGTFDPSGLPGYDALSEVSLGTFFDPVLAAGDAESEQLLGGQGLAPSGAVSSYAQAPPLLLTTLDAAYDLLDPRTYADTEDQLKAPISAIRVRVAGVTGPDEVSRERVRQVAEAIAKTGLQVDITIGSSPTERTIELPAGDHGRPELTLTEYWVKKGVAVAILTAVDKKSVVLFGLVLAVCALVVANAVNASVRARRHELGVLSCLGWPARRLFGLIVTETAILGLIAGILGSAAAWPLAQAAGIAFDHQRALLAIPAAVLLAILAGLGPAITASRTHPADTLTPPVTNPRRARRRHGVTGMAATNTLRTPGRSLLGAASLAIGTAALTLLLGLTLAFRGVLVGSLLGDAVAVQTRTVDYLAVAAMITLGALGVADVLYLNLRERAPEIATLRATGWTEPIITRLIATEGILIGTAGALTGALTGLAAVTTFADTITTTMTLAAITAALTGTTLAAATAALIATSTRRLPTTTLLAEEQ